MVEQIMGSIYPPCLQQYSWIKIRDSEWLSMESWTFWILFVLWEVLLQEVSLPTGEDWSKLVFKVLSNLNHSMILEEENFGVYLWCRKNMDIQRISIWDDVTRRSGGPTALFWTTFR